MGQGQRSGGSRSKVKLVIPGLRVMILAGGLMPTSSCIFSKLNFTKGGETFFKECRQSKLDIKPQLYLAYSSLFSHLFLDHLR